MYIVNALADPLNPLTGTYYGMVNVTGVGTPPVATTLGALDLSFYLDVTGTAIQHDSSYVAMDKTLVFPLVAPQVCRPVDSCTANPPACTPVNTCYDAGPRLTGTASVTGFSLTIDRFFSQVGDKTVSRDVTLSNTQVLNGGTNISGDYTETIIGLDKNPIVVSGNFHLVKPTPVTIPTLTANASGCYDLAAIKAGGSDAAVVEYGDISQALHVYNNPTLTPNICAPRDQVINDALNNYYNSLK